jgi:hypothetical protein
MLDDDWIASTVRRKSDAPWSETASSTGWPKIYGTVDDQTDTKVRVQWPDGSRSWEQKRDLDVLSRT